VESPDDEELVEDQITDIAIRDELQQGEIAREDEEIVDEQSADASDG
jgi:hypothetical protein